MSIHFCPNCAQFRMFSTLEDTPGKYSYPSIILSKDGVPQMTVYMEPQTNPVRHAASRTDSHVLEKKKLVLVFLHSRFISPQSLRSAALQIPG